MLSIPYFTCGYASAYPAYPVAPPMIRTVFAALCTTVMHTRLAVFTAEVSTKLLCLVWVYLCIFYVFSVVLFWVWFPIPVHSISQENLSLEWHVLNVMLLTIRSIRSKCGWLFVVASRRCVICCQMHWRLRGNIIRTAACWVVWHNVHSQQHTHMSSSYRSSWLGLSHCDCDPYAIHRGGCLELYYCNMVEWSWWDSILIWKTN